MTNPEELVERIARVTQIDREAQAKLYDSIGKPGMAEEIRAGEQDDHPGVQAFAKHRLIILASLPGSGWRLVPEVPTDEMVFAGEISAIYIEGLNALRGCADIYTAMLAASPLPLGVSGGE